MSKLLEQVRDLIRTRHYSYRTEEAYLNRIRQYILFHGKRHPAEMGAAEVSQFLTHLVDCKAYDELSTPEIREEWGRTYYGFDVRVIMKRLADWADENKYDGEIQYVFSELARQGGELDRIFKRCLRTPESQKLFRLSNTWTKGLMKNEVRLQSADIIAYELNKRAVNEISGARRYVRKSLDIFQFDDTRLAPLYMGREDLKKLFAGWREPKE